MAYNYFSRREEAKAYAIKHNNLMLNTKGKEIANSVAHTAIYSVDPSFTAKPKVDKSKFLVVSMDSVSAGKKFANGKTAILNFASFKNPGGKYMEGSTAQEESLCAASDLYEVLVRFENDYYAWNRKNLNMALYHNRALYSEDICFDCGFKADVITCAAPNFTAAAKYCHVDYYRNNKVLKERINYVIDIAIEEGVDTIILGAYGCGVFGQDPKVCAEYFLEKLKESPIQNVIFAVPEGINSDNYDAFVDAVQKEDNWAILRS